MEAQVRLAGRVRLCCVLLEYQISYSDTTEVFLSHYDIYYTVSCVSIPFLCLSNYWVRMCVVQYSVGLKQLTNISNVFQNGHTRPVAVEARVLAATRYQLGGHE